MAINKEKLIGKKSLLRAVAESSRIEGLSLDRAKKNSGIIKYLKTHGRAFAL